MRFMMTQNGNYIVEDKSIISLKHKESIITRYAFFNKNHKFIKLTEYLVWKNLSRDRKIQNTEENEENYFFKFPTVFQYNFVDETVNKNNDKIRMFYKWVVKHNHIYPTLSFYKNKKCVFTIKYDIFVGKILEKKNIEYYQTIISEKRNTTFPNWCKYLMFNTINHIEKNDKSLINNFKNS